MISRAIALLTIVGGVSWIVDSATGTSGIQWEPLIIILGAIAALVKTERSAELHHTNPEKQSAAQLRDADLYQRISTLLHPGHIDFFRNHNFRVSFNPSPMRDLCTYVDNWNTAEHEFLNEGVQEAQLRMREAADALASALAVYTTTNRAGLATVEPSRPYEGELPKWAAEQAIELNTLSKAFVDAHQQFTRIARRSIVPQ